MASSSKEESASDSDNSSPESDSERLFSGGEKVLAYHGPRIYEAKVQRAEFRKKEWRYFLHYLGWNKNWDEWVSKDRLMKYTEENKMKQKALDKKAGVDKGTKSGRSSQTKPKSSTDAKADKEEEKPTNAKGKKRRIESINEEKPATEKLIQLQMPPSLKKQLVDDYKYITHQNKLVKLPRAPSVDDVLEKYLEYRCKQDGTMTDGVGEVLNGIASYFDRALPTLLLYAKERQQYRDAVDDDVSPCTVYGPEHLLRLFVKLPELLSHVKMHDESMISLQQILVQFLTYLQDNQSSLFSADAYEVDE